MLLTTLTYKRRVLEVVLDFLVISFAYYLAFGLRYEFQLSDSLLNLFLNSLPIVVAATYADFFFSASTAVYGAIPGLEDLVRIAKAVACGTCCPWLRLSLSTDSSATRASSLSFTVYCCFSAWPAAAFLFVCLVFIWWRTAGKSSGADLRRGRRRRDRRAGVP